MRVFTVCGISGSGKTTTIERSIAELVRRGYSVGSVKEIHFEEFAMDTEGSNTHRHRQAGSGLVTALGLYETDVLYPQKLSIADVLAHYRQEFVVLEGVYDGNFPTIVTAHNQEDLENLVHERVFAIAGRISHELQEYKGIPVFNAMEDARGLVDLMEAKVHERLPDFPVECCGHCGMSCRELGARILKGEATVEDCVVRDAKVKLLINEKEITMVPFVQKILQNAVEAVAKELDGYEEGASITVAIEK